MDLRQYEQDKFAIADILRSASTIAPAEKREWHDRLRGLFARLAEDRFNLVFVGRFSRGKTSLMNALLATDRLPTGIVPLTSVITSVGYGSKERVVLTYHERILTREVPIETLPKYITQQENPGNVQRIKAAEVQLPAELLRRGYYFVDTPGLGSAIAENTRTTEGFLPEADAFLLVTSYESPLSQEEIRFFRAASSAARRIFVVVNKHDTVSEGERKAALAYVRDQLRAVLGPQEPKLFSVSARDGLDGKQSGDASRLVTSGIPALEEELLHFLLAEKSTEFLLRMCDRVADLVRELQRSTEAATVVERITGLSGRIAQDRGRPAGTGPPGNSPAAFPALQQLRPCEVCAQINQALWDFLCQFQYDVSFDHDVQRRLAEHGGLCSFHTWQYDSIASPQGICMGYAALLDRLAACLRDAAKGETERGVLARKTRALLPTRDGCVLCGVRAKAESEAISAIARRLVEDEPRTLDSLSAICLPHFAMLAAAIEDAKLMPRLMDRQAAILERLSEDMERYALKRDAVRRSLATDEEETAAQRALLLVAGHRNVGAT